MSSKIENNPNFMSLYDYLGHAAGGQLGRDVYAAASKKGVPHGKRQVETTSYKGNILTYPEEFLREYFATPRHNDANNTMTTPK